MTEDWYEEQLLDFEIGDRFEAERHPVKTVDGDNPFYVEEA